MSFESITLSEISKTHKDNYCIWFHKVARVQIQSQRVKWWLEWGWEEGGWGAIV